jgi:molybdopterin-containing oxidoreductase family iron-sulfur binding subunit
MPSLNRPAGPPWSRHPPADPPEFWRSLEELAGGDEFERWVRAEFPASSQPLSALDRRRFVQLMGASLALAALPACTRQPLERIVPYVRQPEQVVPGLPLYFATAMPQSGYASPLLVESHLGRPTKIEGNPEHPASLGATDVQAQASILGLYDPDRSKVLRHLGQIETWDTFRRALERALAPLAGDGGAGLRILTETVTSPTLAAQLRAILERYPNARWHQFEPAGRNQTRIGIRRAFGRPLEVRYDLAQADVVLALESDFLTSGPGCVRYARDFSQRRRLDHGGPMARLYAVESSPTNTGAMADHRLALRARALPAFVHALAAELELPGVPAVAQPPTRAQAAFLRALARDLIAHRGRGAVIAGEYAGSAVHVIAHAINQRLGNHGTAVILSEPVEAEPVDQWASLRALLNDLLARRVELLLILGANPIYNAPAGLPLVEGLLRAKLRIHLGPYEDETAAYCQWHVPEAHYLESWGDARAYDGTVTILQPLIEPLYGGKSTHELLAVVEGRAEADGHELVREHWRGQQLAGEFESFWRRALHDGWVEGSARPPIAAEVRAFGLEDALLDLAKGDRGLDALEVNLRPDPNLLDGRFANNAWLQELPRPWTRLTWDNAILLGPDTATALGLRSQDEVELTAQGQTLAAPVWVLPGHPERSATIHLGYGRKRAGAVGNGVGFDAYPLRSFGRPWLIPMARLTKTGRRLELACTQDHHSMENRGLVRSAALQHYHEHPEFAREHAEPGPEMSLYPGFGYDGYAWGMTVDLSACTGCNACVIACQAENNIAVVGKDQVLRGRELHWLRIDRYFEGDPAAPRVVHQPVMCQHCEQAPCEVVCPVEATVHSSEGLNEMVYNRCVGTKYCSNNCPYKVRRFNFYEYSDTRTPVLKLMRNPDVTVRTIGVMEKCSYCVQRINGARVEAEKQGRSIRDGEVVTACQQVCPSQAIVFGDLNDPQSQVRRLRDSRRAYRLLADLNTRPRTTYLAKIRNPNPELEPG